MLLVDVLTGLGGASQENQQPAIFWLVLQYEGTKARNSFKFVTSCLSCFKDLVSVAKQSRGIGFTGREVVEIESQHSPGIGVRRSFLLRTPVAEQ